MNTATYPSAAQAATLTGADHDHALVAVEQARREVEAAYVAVLDRAESTNRFTHDGHAGVRGWATALTNTGSVELHRRLQTMRALRDLPDVATALAAGDIGVDQVREIAKLHANPRTRDLTINSSSTLLDHARTTACVDFFVATAGASNPMAALPRTDAQRRFDALHSLFLGAVSAPPGSVAPEPVINIIMSIQEYEDRLEQLATGTRPAPATVDDIDTGLPIDPTDAVTASLTGWFRRVIIDSAGVVIDLGRKRRFTGSARVAVILSRRRCLWPGCGRASTRNHIDHTHDHARGGRTTPHNGGPACGRHNRTKTRGYTVHRDTHGNWHVHRPDGTELTQPAIA